MWCGGALVLIDFSLIDFSLAQIDFSLDQIAGIFLLELL